MLEEYPRKKIHDHRGVTIVIQTRHQALCERFGVPKNTPEETVLQMWDDLQRRGEEELKKEADREAAHNRLKDFDADQLLANLTASPNDVLTRLVQAISDIQLTKGLK